jgi:hypothetical protein
MELRFHFITNNSLFHDVNESLYLKKQGDVPLMIVPSVDRKLIFKSLNATIQTAGYFQIPPGSFNS